MEKRNIVKGILFPDDMLNKDKKLNLPQTLVSEYGINIRNSLEYYISYAITCIWYGNMLYPKLLTLIILIFKVA